MLTAAIEYAERGFPVFPVGADCKPGRLAWEFAASGFIAVYEATTDRDVIEDFWTRFPVANISMATGFVSGVFVLDVDKHDGAANGFETLAELVQRFGRLPRTWKVKTPNDGRHIYFRHPDRALRNRVKFQPGLDVRTAGGAVPLPPSRKSVGSYTWMVEPSENLADAPAWLLDLIDPPQPPRKPMQPIHVQSLDRTARYVGAAVNDECHNLASMGQNSGRNLRLFQASANLGEFVGAGLLSQDTAEDALERAAEECGLTREDGIHSVRASIRSGMRKGLMHPREVCR